MITGSINEIAFFIKCAFLLCRKEQQRKVFEWINDDMRNIFLKGPRCSFMICKLILSIVSVHKLSRRVTMSLKSSVKIFVTAFHIVQAFGYCQGLYLTLLKLINCTIHGNMCGHT